MISELRETLYSCLVPLQRHQNESKGVKFCDLEMGCNDKKHNKNEIENFNMKFNLFLYFYRIGGKYSHNLYF